MRMPDLVSERIRQVVREFEQRARELEGGHEAELDGLNDELKQAQRELAQLHQINAAQVKDMESIGKVIEQ